MFKITRLLICTFLLLTGASILLAQVSTQGSILGTVVDSSGAVIPGAQVIATNLDTGLIKRDVTDPSGNFEILALPIGNYSVAVTAQGFKTWALAKMELTVGERSRISPTLQVGDVSEQVSVESSGGLLQTESSDVQTVIQMQQIRELPLSQRNPVALVSLAPGMRYLGSGGPERGSTVQGMGTRDNQTEFQLDGLNSNAAMDEGGMAIPNVDAIAEFSVETNSFSAESGRDPVQVILVTKSGSNAFHGAAWEFLQNDVLNARNTFALTVPKLRRNQYGFAAGGP